MSSATNINITITEETPFNITLTEDTLINVSIQGYSIAVQSLGDLSDVTISNPSTNHLLIYNGNKFINDEVLKYLEDSDEFEIKLF